MARQLVHCTGTDRPHVCPLQVMWHDALHAISIGAHGLVLGMLTEAGHVATDQL